MRDGVKPAKISDFDLAQKFVGGNAEAFKQIYERHESRILTLCRRMTCTDDADDLAQNTWIRVFEKIGEFRNESKFTTWLHKIAVNICLRHIENNKRETTLSEEQWRNQENSVSVFATRAPLSPHAILEQKINDERFDNFVATLDADDRVIFVNRIVEELEPREIVPLLQNERSPEYVSNRFGKLRDKFGKFICEANREGGETKI